MLKRFSYSRSIKKIYEKVYTYVRVRTDDEQSKRFGINTDGNKMIITYNPIPKQLYYQYDDGTTIEAKKYLDSYFMKSEYGPFHKVFESTIKNKAIAEEESFKNIKNKLTSGETVVILGWGSSGSGKTSTLINFYDKNTGKSQEGIITYLCNNLIGDFDAIKLNSKEIKVNPNKYENINSKNPTEKVNYEVKKKIIDAIFKPDKNKKVWKEDITKNEERLKNLLIEQEKIEKEKIEKEKIENEKLQQQKQQQQQQTKNNISNRPRPKQNKTDGGGINDILEKIKLEKDYVSNVKDLGKKIVHEMDTNRHIDATPNNPVSSRSHYCIELIFTNSKESEKKCKLIILDLAGSEDEFKCNNKNTINMFMNIKDVKTKAPYYKDNKEYKEIYSKLIKTQRPTFEKNEKKDEEQDIKNLINICPDIVKLLSLDIFTNKYLKIEYKSPPFSPQLKEIFTYLKIEIGEMFTKTKNIESEIPDIKRKFAELLTKVKYISIEDDVYKEICTRRTKEGYLINYSLKQLREFITYFTLNIANSGNMMKFPPFLDECVVFQCNPYFNSCFGINYGNVSTTRPESIIIEHIIENEDEINKLNFLIINVINTSRISANNPPPIPYVDIGDLRLELEKMKNKSIFTEEQFGQFTLPTNEKYHLNNSLEKLEVMLGLKDPTNEINLDRKFIIPVGKLTKADFKQEILDEYYVEEKNVFDKSFIQEIEKLLKLIRNNTDTEKNLSKLIEIITLNNSLTTIGTMEFIDSISKFGLNDIGCIFTDRNRYIKEIDENKSLKQFIKSS